MPQRHDGAEEPTGFLGAVLRAAGTPGPVSLAPGGPTLVTTLEDSRIVLTSPAAFELPFDVSRRRIRRDGPQGKATPPLAASAVAVGRKAFVEELAAAGQSLAGDDVDTLVLLRAPVARSTTAALVPEADPAARAEVAELVLAWVDSLAPVISAEHSPGRWSRTRRAEGRARRTLVAALTRLGCEGPAARATALAAGIQVPIAAGAWCLTQLAGRPALQESVRADPALATGVVWEVLRMFPPTWLLPRITTSDVQLGGSGVPAYSVVVVSPVALGRLPDLAPGPEAGRSTLDDFDPGRWTGDTVRPGAWLPFGAGAHACPGRNLGLAQLTHLVAWAAAFDFSAPRPPSVDTSRGLSPSPSRVRAVPHSEAGA